jgi:glutaryl-CoA dehydrogenase
MFRPVYRHAARQLQTPARSAAIGRRYLHAPVKFDWQDPLNLSSLLTEEEAAISETAESYCQERMLPRILGTSSDMKLVYMAADVHVRGIPQ